MQLVNYEKVLSSVEDFAFPIIEAKSLTFTRDYEQEGDKIRFERDKTDPSGNSGDRVAGGNIVK